MLRVVHCSVLNIGVIDEFHSKSVLADSYPNLNPGHTSGTHTTFKDVASEKKRLWALYKRQHEVEKRCE